MRSAGCAALGLIAVALPLPSQAAVEVLVSADSEIKAQPNEIINVRNDTFETGSTPPTFTTLARSKAPPLRVTGATYRGVALNATIGDLCLVLPDFEDPDIGFGGTLTISLQDDETGSTGTVSVKVTQGGGGDTSLAGCHDIAKPVASAGYPYTTQVDEDTPAGVLLPTADLLGVLRDPNGGQVSWNPPLSLQPANAGTLVLVGTVQDPGGIRFTPAANFFTAPGQFVTVSYTADDPHGDGPVTFDARVTVNPVNDAPTIGNAQPACTVGAAGGPCSLSFDDIDTAASGLTVTITAPPQGGDLGPVNVAARQVVYTPRPGTMTDQFSFTVSDGGQGPFPTATVSVTVSDAAQDPVPRITVTRVDGTPLSSFCDIPDSDGAAGELVRLDGSSSSPGNPPSPLTYEWTVNQQVLPQRTATVDVRLAEGRNTVALHLNAEEFGPAVQVECLVAVQPNAPSSARIVVNGVQVSGVVPIGNADFQPGETVIFDGSQSTDPEGDPIVQYTWSLNGQQAQSGTSPTVSLRLPDGTNTVVLTVTDNRGGTGTTTITPTVDSDPDLSSLSGLTPSERSMGNAISELCPRMNALPGSSLTAGQLELLNRCSDILNDDDPNAQRAALDALTPDEITSQQTTGIDFTTSQLGNLTSRLAALRQGANGLSIAGLTLRDASGKVVPVEELAALAKHLAGGASGDDEDASLAARWGFFVNGNVIDGKKDETIAEAGYDFGGWGVTAGFDYRFTERFVLGLSLGYNEAESDFAEDGGSLDSEGVSTSLYGTYFDERWYADFIGSSGALDYESMRNIAYSDAGGTNRDVARGLTNGDLSTLGVSFGYDFNKGGWTFGPTVALTSVEIDIDAFAETGAGQSGGVNLAFGDQQAESRTAQGGFQFSYAMSKKWGVLSPQMRVAFVKEFENESQTINVRFVNDPFANDPSQPSPGAITVVTDNPDEEYLRWGVGLTFVRASGMSAFIDYEGLAGLDTVSSGEFTFGFRFERSFK